MNLSADTGKILADIVEEASQLILPLWRSGLTVDSKADQSPVTEADRQGEILIVRRLEQLFPGVHVISEEDASEFGTPDAIGDTFFLVDPVDGTKAFVRGDVHYTVNIGLIRNGRPIAGAVGAPAMGQTWYTTAAGTMRRGPEADAAPVRVRRWPAGEAVALISHTMKPEVADRLEAEYGFHKRLPMDSSIKFCMIAQGDADIYPRHGPTMEWDIAAAHAVLEGAGGTVLTPDGKPVLYGKAGEGFRNGWFVARGG